MRTFLSVFADKQTAEDVAEKLKKQGVDPNQMAIANGRPARQMEWPDVVQEWQEKGYTVLLAQAMKYLEPQVEETLVEQEPVHMEVLAGIIGDEEWMDDMRYVPTPHTKDLYVPPFASYEPVFREIWENEFRPGEEEVETPERVPFHEYLPVFRYGYELATTPRFRTQKWAEIAESAGREWAETHDTLWDEIEHLVEAAWEVVRDAFEDVEQGLDHDERRNAYHDHFNQTYAARGLTYSRYAEAYRYGELLAEDAQYQDRQWPEIALAVEERWTNDHPAEGAWDDVKDAIRHAWEQKLRKG